MSKTGFPFFPTLMLDEKKETFFKNVGPTYKKNIKTKNI
jgi:hypothetical protein